LYYRYWELLFFPTIQSPEYTFNCIPAVESFDDPRSHYSFAACGIVLVLVLFCVGRIVWSWIRGDHLLEKEATAHNDVHISEATSSAASGSKADPFVQFHEFTLLQLLSWFLISFFPITGIVFTLGTLLAERLLYIPSIATSLFLSYVVYLLIEWVFLTFFCTRVTTKHSEKVSQALRTTEGKNISEEYNGSVVYETITTHTKVTMKRTTVSTFMTTIMLLLYGIIWSAALYFHVTHLRAYNLTWYDDESLFLHAVKICPTSAKANLQLSKLYSSKQEWAMSWKHMMVSKQIDPDFCDTGYQEALLGFTKLSRSMENPSEDDDEDDEWGFDWKAFASSDGKKNDAANNNMEDSESMKGKDKSSTSSNVKNGKKKSNKSKSAAMKSKLSSWSTLSYKEKQAQYDYHFHHIIQVLLKNLHCVYSSHQSLELLLKLWNHQLNPYDSLQPLKQLQQQGASLSSESAEKKKLQQQIELHRQRVQIVYRQGKLAFEQGIYVFSLQKLQECASIAFDLEEYEIALESIDLATQSIQRYEEEQLKERQVSGKSITTSAERELTTLGDDKLDIFTCRIYALSGTMRFHLLSADAKTAGNEMISSLKQQYKKYLSQKTILRHLLHATSPGRCVRLIFPNSLLTSSSSVPSMESYSLKNASTQWLHNEMPTPAQLQILEHVKTANQYLLHYAQTSSQDDSTGNPVPVLQRDFEEIYFYTNTLTIAYIAEYYVLQLHQLQNQQQNAKKSKKSTKSASGVNDQLQEQEKILMSTKQQLLQLYKHIATQRYQQRDYILASQYYFYYLLFIHPSVSPTMLYQAITSVYPNQFGTKTSGKTKEGKNTIVDHISVWKNYPWLLNSTIPSIATISEYQQDSATDGKAMSKTKKGKDVDMTNAWTKDGRKVVTATQTIDLFTSFYW
jgi:hypothetical protein